MSDRKFTLTETRTVTLADGTPFADITVRYHGLDEAGVVEMEAEMLATFQQRLEWAKARIKG